MHPNVRFKQWNQTLVGWLLAVVCAIAGIVFIHSKATRELSLVVYVNGEPLCSVENKAVVDEALLLLNNRFDHNGMAEDAFGEITYRYAPSDLADADAERCMELLYDICSRDYSRAYMISIGGIEIAACATYAEAERVVDEFRIYIIEQVLGNESDADQVELTTEIRIDSVFCRSDRIATSEEICRLMMNDHDGHDDELENGASDTRVSADGSHSLLYADKNFAFGMVKNESVTQLPEYDFSVNVGGLNSAIQYKVYVLETYSEIIAYQTVYIDSEELYVGQTKVVEDGENGIAENVYEIAYIDGVEVSRTLVSSKTISEAKDRVVYVGVKEYPSTTPTGTFIWPIQQKFVITSEYGLVRDGFESSGEYHLGIDIGVPRGTPIYAADGGTVTYAGEFGTYGLHIRILHENGVETYYAHMRSIDVKVGDKVYQGQKIAEVGTTGRTTGPHLHFEVRINGKTVNPRNYLPTTMPWKK